MKEMVNIMDSLEQCRPPYINGDLKKNYQSSSMVVVKSVIIESKVVF